MESGEKGVGGAKLAKRLVSYICLPQTNLNQEKPSEKGGKDRCGGVLSDSQNGKKLGFGVKRRPRKKDHDYRINWEATIRGRGRWRRAEEFIVHHDSTKREKEKKTQNEKVITSDFFERSFQTDGKSPKKEPADRSKRGEAKAARGSDS